MQAVTAEIEALLTAEDIEVEGGCELLVGDEVTDISSDLLDGWVERSNYAEVHGRCELQLLRSIPAGSLLRVFLVVNGFRVNVGVYVTSQSEEPIGEDPATRQITGEDKMSLLTRDVGDTYVVGTGSGYLAAAQQALVDAGVGLPPAFFEGTAVTLGEPMVWALAPDAEVRWVRVVNDLLGKVGYRGLWADGDGRYRSDLYRPPSERAPEWTFDLDDPRTDLDDEERTVIEDAREPTNWWRFVRRGMATAPVEGSGLYTVDDASTGLHHPRTLWLDAASQESLVAQGDQIVQQDRQITRTVEITTGPLPIAGHFDVVTYRDVAIGELKCQARYWKLPLVWDETTSMRWTLEVV